MKKVNKTIALLIYVKQF